MCITAFNVLHYIKHYFVSCQRPHYVDMILISVKFWFCTCESTEVIMLLLLQAVQPLKTVVNQRCTVVCVTAA